MGTLRGWIIASWTLLPGVIAGGTLLLRRVALGDPTAFQVTWLGDGSQASKSDPL